jgi:hypothetical protein
LKRFALDGAAGLVSAKDRIQQVQRRGTATDRHGKTWVATVVAKEEAAQADFDFWFDNLTPNERVAAVEDCLLSSLKAQGIEGLPRFRRVYRVVQRNWR